MKINSDFLNKLLVTHQSEYVIPGGTFVAIKGKNHDGINFISEALKKGARRIVVEEKATLDDKLIENINNHNAELMVVKNSRKTLAELCAQEYQYPANKLRIIGITGTKGKSTTAFLTYQLLKNSGLKVALLSGIHNIIENEHYDTELTTQHSDYINAFLHECTHRKITHVVIEIAAQALSLYRLEGITLQIAVWLNFSKEHGEFYTTELDYFNAKKKILDLLLSGGQFITNSSDRRLKNLKLRTDINRLFINDKDVNSTSVLKNPTITCNYEGINYISRSTLAGKFNGKNLLAAIMIARLEQLSASTIQSSIDNTQTLPPGRFSFYPLPNGATACIDYAHEEISFESVLSELREYTNQLILIFGAGGDRDKTKRPLMGAVAEKYADLIILTTDKPRTENVIDINSQILKGISNHDKVIIQLNREAAIHQSYSLSNKGSIIVILGMGPELYQIETDALVKSSDKSIFTSIADKF